MQRIEVNVQTGERTVIDLTPEEIAEAQARTAAEAEARKPRVVTMRQARLALLETGRLEQVSAAVSAAGAAAAIEWEFAATVERDWPLVVQLCGALGMTDAEIDALFALAATK